MKVLFTPRFERNIKKLHLNEKQSLDQVIKAILLNPLAGESKKGDLVGVRVYKYNHHQQLLLLAYIVDSSNDQIILIGHGTHENFYRDLKK
jgi:mRNA-degrading endonuclease YafQ of YafQ-DinJ toxin-antitoxin module